MTQNLIQFERLGKKHIDLYLRDWPGVRVLLLHVVNGQFKPITASHKALSGKLTTHVLDGSMADLDETLLRVASETWGSDFTSINLYHNQFEAKNNVGTFMLCLFPGLQPIRMANAFDILDSLSELFQLFLASYPVTAPHTSPAPHNGKGADIADLLEKMPVVTYRVRIGTDWEMEHISPYIYQLTGIDHVEFVTRKYNLAHFIHPDDLESVMASLTKAIADKQEYELNYRLIHISGKVSHVIGKGSVDPQNAMIAQGLIIDITSKYAVEQKLFDTQKQIKSIFESINQAIITTDKHGTITYINQTACKLTGWESHEATGQSVGTIFQMIDADTRAPIDNPFEEVYRTLSAYAPNTVAKLVSRYGIELPMQHAAAPLFDNGHFTGMVLNFWDLTETYYERETMRRLKIAIDNSQDGFYIINKKGQFLFANKPIMTRLNADDITIHSKTIWDVIPAGVETNFEQEWEALATKRYVEFERPAVVNGKPVCMQIRNYMINYDKIPYVVGVVRDISALKEIQMELAEGKKTLSFLIDNISIVPYRYNLQSHLISYVGQQSKKILNISNDKWGSFEGWLNCLHPEDRENTVAQINNLIASAKSSSFEYRIVDDHKTVKWVRDVVNIVHNENGRPAEVVGFMMDITDEKRREREISEAKQLFETTLDSVQAAIYLIRPDKKLVSVNKYCLDIFGLSKNALNGKEALDFVPPEATTEIYKAFEKVLDTKETQITEHTLTMRGKVNTALTSLVPIFDDNGEISLICGSSIDITQTKRVLIELEKVKERLDFALSAGNIAIWDYFLVDGKVVTNSVFKTWTNFPPANTEGEFSWLIRYVHPIDIGVLYKAYYGTKKSNQQSFECELRLRVGDDQYIWTLLMAKIVGRSDDNEPIRIIGVHIDISRQKSLLLELSKAKEAAEEANRAKSLFLANLSHEIRTPMNAILGFAQMLEKQMIDPMLQNHVESIKSGGKNLLNLINDILDLSKIEANKVTVKYEPVDIRHVASEMDQLFNYRYQQKGLDFMVIISNEVPQWFYLDELKLKQILINLIGNAIKFTDLGSVALRVDYQKQLAQSGNLLIEVSDSGIGISPTSQKTIFEPFVQHENHDARKYGGTGLGLSITQKLTELMNGEITVKSEVNVGTTMSLVFRNVDFDPEYNMEKNAATNVVDLKDASILMVALQPNGMEHISKHLIFHQMDVYEALGFNDAIKVFKAQLPNLVIVQAWNGQTVEGFAQFMQMATAAKTPVLAVPHDASVKNVLPIDGFFFNDVIQMPIMHETLIKTIKKHYSPTRPTQPDPAQTTAFSEAKAQSIVEASRHDIAPLIKELLLIQPSQQVKELAEKLTQLGHQCQYPPFIDFGTKLSDALKFFDVAGIESTIKTIDKHYTQIQHIANHEQQNIDS